MIVRLNNCCSVVLLFRVGRGWGGGIQSTCHIRLMDSLTPGCTNVLKLKFVFNLLFCSWSICCVCVSHSFFFFFTLPFLYNSFLKKRSCVLQNSPHSCFLTIIFMSHHFFLLMLKTSTILESSLLSSCDV